MGWISKDVRIYPSVPYKDGFREIVLKEDHEKVLAEKDREIVKWSELIGSFTRSQHQYLVEMERLKQALAEKDREIEYLQECRISAAAMDAQRIIEYQQLMEKAARFAREWQNPTGYPSQVEAYQFLQSPEVQAWKERQP